MSRTDKTSQEARTGRIDLGINSHGKKPWLKKLEKNRKQKLRHRADQATRTTVNGIHRLDEARDFDVHPAVESYRTTRLRTRNKKVLA